MSGHSHWAGIKHKKGAKDQKRAIIFSKLLNAISAAAKTEPNPDFNPRLRTAIEKAEAASVPQDNIKRALERSNEKIGGLEELLFEAYGPSGIAILISVITSSRNRAVAEVKKTLSDNKAKWAEPGSVMWAFENIGTGKAPQAKFTQELSAVEAEQLDKLLQALQEHEDIQETYTNANVKNK